MAVKKVKFDFYQLIFPDDFQDNLAVLLDHTFPADVGKSAKDSGQYIRLESYKRHTQVRYGVISKFNIDVLPPKACITKPGLESLGLNDDEGVANLTGYLIAPKYNVVILQRSQQGVRTGSFLHMLEKITGLRGLELSIILEPDVIAKFNKMQMISKFVYKVSNPQLPIDFKEMSIEHASNISRTYNARNVSIELSMGIGKKTSPLSKQEISRTVRNLLRINKSADQSVPEIYSLTVRGKENEDEKIEPLDLLKGRLYNEVEIGIIDRGIPQSALENAALASYDSKEEDLEHYKPL